MQKAYVLKEVVVYVENKPGALYRIASAVGDRGINIESIVAYAKDDNNAEFRIITADNNSTIKTLKNVEGVKYIKEDEVLVLTLENKPKELSKVAGKLSKNGIDLESLYILGKNEKSTDIAIKPSKDNIEKAKQLLGE